MKKICNKCGIERPLEKFSPRKPRKHCWHDGRENVCLYCRAEHDLINRKWPQKYRHFDKRELFKVKEKEKYYFTDSGSLYIQLKIGFRRVKSDFITIGNKQVKVEKLKDKYLAIA
jgi:hypothetical protein